LLRGAMGGRQFVEGGVGRYEGKHFLHVDVRGYAARWADR